MSSEMSSSPVSVSASAPGRLDMLGGVADYSGSLVLEVATSVCTTVTATLHPAGSAGAAGAAADAASLSSAGFPPVTLPLSLLSAGRELSLPGVRAALEGAAAPHWARYVFGSLAVLVRATGWLPPRGAALTLAISSTVPLAQGVSSSASVECATLRALRALAGAPAAALGDLALAHLAQAAENLIVGAPCGLMDQLASMLGAPGRVLPILCRPDAVSPPVALPPSAVLIGWPSGVKHSVADSPYLVARTATFMGRRMAEAHCAGLRLAHAAELAPSALRRDVLPALPAPAISGAAFTAAYGPLADELSRVEPERVYGVAAALTFPVEENNRCALALALLRGHERERAAADAAGAPHPPHGEALTQVGELMMQAHAAYTAIGLGAPQTDAIVRLLAAVGPQGGVYGARVSGGGSGGTVVVLCERAALPTVQRLAEENIFDGVPFTKLIE